MSEAEEVRVPTRWRRAWRLLLLLTQAGIVLGSLGVFVLASIRYLAIRPYQLDIPSNFQVHYLCVALVFLVLSLVLRFRIGAALATLLIAYQAMAFIPYYFGGEPRATTANLRVGIANIYGANRHFQEFGNWVAEDAPDILLLQESEERWPAYLKILAGTYPHSHTATHDAWGFDATIMSRRPILEYSVIPIPHVDFPVQRAVIDVDGTRVALYNVHLFPATVVRARQNETLREVFASEKLPYVVAGDFNATIWSSAQRKMLDGMTLRNAAFGFGYQPTWPARVLPLLIYAEHYILRRSTGLVRRSGPESFAPFAARLLGIPLDHCYVSPEIGVAGYHRGPGINSDHLPITVDLAVAPPAAS